METKTAGPHKYDPDPRTTGAVMLCMCGATQAFRSHQPWYWRWTHKKLWR